VNSKSKLGLLFLSFSITRNLRKLCFASGDSEPELKALNGLRVQAMAWGILGHTFLVCIMGILGNPEDINKISSQFIFSIVPGAYYAVDIFFFLSGFLAVYLML
jgi:peptidoglycan/LPS O-acetylase OafA/YrhL